jgi:transposase
LCLFETEFPAIVRLQQSFVAAMRYALIESPGWSSIYCLKARWHGPCFYGERWVVLVKKAF